MNILMINTLKHYHLTSGRSVALILQDLMHRSILTHHISYLCLYFVGYEMIRKRAELCRIERFLTKLNASDWPLHSQAQQPCL